MDHLIELDGLGRTFGPFEALRGVSLRLKPGRIGLLGPNGAGKSTLLKILLGLLPVSSGSGRVFGHALGPPEQRFPLVPGPRALVWSLRHALFGNGVALRRSVGYLPEADALIPG